MTEPTDQQTDDGTEIKDLVDIKHRSDVDCELVREYDADGTLYVYREGDEHVIVSRGRDPSNQWVDRKPATRTAVIPGEQLWSIPSNWEKRVTISGTGNARYAIYRIPEPEIDVLVTVPRKNRLVDAWYNVKRVGAMTVTYADEIKWGRLKDHLDRIESDEDNWDVEDDAIEALQQLYRQRRSFEDTFAECVNMHAYDAVFENHNRMRHGPLSINEWLVEPWGDTFGIERLLQDFLGVDSDLAKRVDRELSNTSQYVIPSYPLVRVDVEDRLDLPNGWDIRALDEAGCSGAEIRDYLIVEHYGEMTQSEWANRRGATQSAVSKNISSAKRNIKS